MVIFFTNLSFALNVTLPIMLVMALGAFLVRRQFLDEAFLHTGSKLVFNVTLPAMLFIVISGADFSETANLAMLTTGYVGTITVFLMMEVIAFWLVRTPENRGVVVQGAFRANMGIVGLAFCVNAYGEMALAASAVYLALVTILYNVLAVITLNRSLHGNATVLDTAKGIIKNPLILSILCALPFSYFGWRPPEILFRSGSYFAQMTLPLALLCAGGALSLKNLKLDSRSPLVATLGKVIFTPSVMVLTGWLFGLNGMDLGIVFLMSAAPSASASFIMVQAMGGNGKLAANIIVLTTLGSIVFTSLGITVLYSFKMM